MSKAIINKYDSACRICGESIPAGEEVLWYKGWGIKHPGCNGEVKANNGNGNHHTTESPAVVVNTEKQAETLTKLRAALAGTGTGANIYYSMTPLKRKTGWLVWSIRPIRRGARLRQKCGEIGINPAGDVVIGIEHSYHDFIIGRLLSQGIVAIEA